MNTSQSGLRNALLVAAACLMLAVSLLLMAGATHAWFTASITSKGNTITAKDEFPEKEQQAELIEPAEDPAPQSSKDAVTAPGESEPVVPESPTTPDEPATPVIPEEPAETDKSESDRPTDSASPDSPVDTSQSDASETLTSTTATPPQGEQ